jgi:hypothetical protein
VISVEEGRTRNLTDPWDWGKMRNGRGYMGYLEKYGALVNLYGHCCGK